MQEVFEAATRIALRGRTDAKSIREREKAAALATKLAKLVDDDKLAAFHKKLPALKQLQDQMLDGTDMMASSLSSLLEAVRNRLLPGVSTHGGHEWLAAAAKLTMVPTSLSNAKRLGCFLPGRSDGIKEQLLPMSG